MKNIVRVCSSCPCSCSLVTSSSWLGDQAEKRREFPARIARRARVIVGDITRWLLIKLLTLLQFPCSLACYRLCFKAWHQEQQGATASIETSTRSETTISDALMPPSSVVQCEFPAGIVTAICRAFCPSAIMRSKRRLAGRGVAEGSRDSSFPCNSSMRKGTLLKNLYVPLAEPSFGCCVHIFYAICVAVLVEYRLNRVGEDRKARSRDWKRRRKAVLSLACVSLG